MFLRKWLTITINLALAGLLTACSSTDSLLSDPSGNDSGSTHSIISPNHNDQNDSGNDATTNNSSSSDTIASDDYFHDQSSIQNSHNNLWVAIREDFQLNHYAKNPAVQSQINWYMHNQDYLDRTARRAAPYMYYIYQEVKARNLPSELVLLPIIESAYNPFASSDKGAAGLWQIEPGTAHTFGLREDLWYDGRRDITASTNAALDYFSYLQNYFGGDWLLAIAAYDTGEGNVESAIHRNARNGLPTDYWSLPLAAETQAYVPRLLALAIIISDPKDYPVNLPAISNEPYLGEVEISSQVTLNQAAGMAGVSTAELKTLNPQYRLSTLDPHQPYKLLLPLDRVSFFKQNLLNTPTNEGGLWGRYKVQPGDTWKKIAKRFNTSLGLIQQVNRLNTRQPPIGEVLLIPENQNDEAAIATATTQEASDGSTSYNGVTDNNAMTASTDNVNDTSDNSSNSNTTNTATIVNTSDSSATNSDNSDDITVAAPDLSDAANLDQSAMKSLDAQNARSGSQGLHLYKVIHTIKNGETISSIANSHHVSAVEVANWNHLSIHSQLKHGERIVIWRKADGANKLEHTNTKKFPSHPVTHAARAENLKNLSGQHHRNIVAVQKKAKISRHAKVHNTTT